MPVTPGISPGAYGAGIAVGVDGLFIETHFDPANAKSDGANMLHLDHFEGLMTRLVAIRKTITSF